jgi:putative Mg2+ transporter-C (MgtC) family protein
MNFHADVEILYRLLISFGIGTAIGLEREYRSKAAGLRTMIMICLGSTIFTQVSMGLGGVSNPDRIASTIVSGIGFLGAGVIFKDGLSITGITTATTIWISAALGMAVGAGEYFIALIGGGIVLIVLIILEKIQVMLERSHQTRTYRISFDEPGGYEQEINQKLHQLKLGFRRKRDLKTDKCSVIVYEIFGSANHFNQFHDFLKKEKAIRSYEY